MSPTSPRAGSITLAADPRFADGADERFTGYGVMGAPFTSGHYLALRVMLASSVGPAYRAVWHRAPEGAWTICTTAAPDLSCPRYFGAAATSQQVPEIDVAWPGEHTLQVTMGDRISWRIELARTVATRLASAMSTAMPDAAWDSDAVLGSMGPMAGGLLRSGRIRLRGTTPNGPWFRAAPLQVWRVVGGRARVAGADLGPLGPLPGQARLGDFWLPQRGLFFVGRASFEARHAPVTGAWR